MLAYRSRSSTFDSGNRCRTSIFFEAYFQGHQDAMAGKIVEEPATGRQCLNPCFRDQSSVRFDQRHSIEAMVSPGLSSPNRLCVYDFIADPSRIPPDSAIGVNPSVASTPPTADELENARQLGANLSKFDGRYTGDSLPAVQAGPGSVPQVGDGVIRSYLISVEGGRAARRFMIGFGSGSSEMDAIIE